MRTKFSEEEMKQRMAAPYNEAPKKATVFDTIALNVRNAPHGDIVNTIDYGTLLVECVPAEGTNKEWYEATMPDGTRGFVMAKYLKFE